MAIVHPGFSRKIPAFKRSVHSGLVSGQSVFLVERYHYSSFGAPSGSDVSRNERTWK